MKILNYFSKNIFCYYFLKMIGLCPFTLTKKGHFEPSFFGTLINLILLITYLHSCTVCYVRRFHIYTPKDTQIAVVVDVLALVFQSLSVIDCLLIFGFRQKYIIEFFKRFGNIEERFSRIIVKKRKMKNLTSTMSLIKTRVVIVGMTYFFICLLDHSRFFIINALDIGLTHWIFFRSIYAILIISNYVFIELIIVVKSYFHELNSLIKRNFEFLILEGNNASSYK